MFLGQYTHTVDPKGRIVLPSSFRESLLDGVVITKGFEKCLFIFPLSEWPMIEEKIKSQSTLKSEFRKLARFFFGGAEKQIPTKKQGRVLIPAYLRDYAELNKDIVILGVSDRIEVWDKDKWTEYEKEGEATYAEAAERLADFGL